MSFQHKVVLQLISNNFTLLDHHYSLHLKKKGHFELTLILVGNTFDFVFNQ